MENAGLVTFREELLLYDENSASAKTKRDVAMTIAHELAHQWFGNLVTMKWWDDLWLNEGFATFMESVVVDRWRPEMNAELELLSLAGWVMDVDALSTARAVRKPVANTHQALDAFDGITYVKGAAFVRMLEGWLGESAFQLGMKAYLSEHAWGNAGADDLFRALERTSTKKVSAVADTFLNATGVPVVRAELACGGGLPPRVKLVQRAYRGLVAATDAPKSDRQWRIPVCIEHGRKAQDQTQRDCTLLEEPSREVALSTEQCPQWMLPNADYAGYYRFAMPEDQLEMLAERTRPRATADNIGFLSNLWALVQSGDVEAPAMLELVLAYKSEKRREVIEEVIKVLEHVSDALVEPKARPAFEKYVSALLLPTAKRLGWDANPGDSEDDRLLRRSVLSAMSRLSDDPWMTLQARKRALAFLSDPDAVGRDTASIALTHAARQGDLGFDQLKARLDAADEPAERIIIIEALASLTKPGELEKTLGLITSGKIRAQDGVYVARAAAQVPQTRTVLIDWLRAHVQEVAEKMPGFGLARMVSVVRHLCDVDARDSVGKSLGAAIEKLGRSRQRLDVALETASLCIDLRARQADDVTTYLVNKKRF
jgi:aminopeptidase N